MTTEIATNEPREVRAGLTWEWERTLSDYPASTWTLKYWFKQMAASGARFSITATASGDKHVVTHAASSSQTYTADDYSWVAVVTSGSEAFEVDRGVMKILPRYDVDTALDDRSHARKVLDAIEAVLESRATKDQEEYTIGSRTLKRTPIAELIKLRDKYKAELNRETLEENARNGLEGGKLVVRL